MTERNKTGTTVQTIIQTLPIVIAGIAILMGSLQFNATKEEEFKKRFWEERVKLYTEAISVAASLAMGGYLPDNEIVDGLNSFWRLYWGKLAMVEHQEVSKAMIALGGDLGNCKPVQDGGEVTDYCRDTLKSDLIKQRVYELALCVRSSLNKTWMPMPTDILPDKVIDSKITIKQCPYLKKRP